MSWDDWSVSNPPPIVDDEKWHVQFAPDEVKIVSLEQMDDLFRLSIIDSETPVWQAGMREWQPLRVIAGLEEEPTPQPQRSHPKPPTPNRSASPSVRPPPPAPRPVAASVRPPAPERRPAPPPERRPAPPPARPAYVAPASFYPEPVLADTYASTSTYAAPIAFAAPVNAMNSVRPLVVSHLPPPARSGGGGFGRFLVGVSLLAGVAVTAYRNDFVRDGAHAAHQDALYARLESALGGPAFGTVRALERSAAAQPMLDAQANEVATVRSAITSPAVEAPSTPTSSPTTSGATPVVSLESLTPEKKGQGAAASLVATHSPSTPAQAAPTTARATATFAQPKQAPVPAKPQPARAVAAPKAPAEKPAPQKPASEMTDRERLNAAIGQSMMQSAPPKTNGGKAKSKGNEYDPLNPSL